MSKSMFLDKESRLEIRFGVSFPKLRVQLNEYDLNPYDIFRWEDMAAHAETLFLHNYISKTMKTRIMGKIFIQIRDSITVRDEQFYRAMDADTGMNQFNNRD